MCTKVNYVEVDNGDVDEDEDDAAITYLDVDEPRPVQIQIQLPKGYSLRKYDDLWDSHDNFASSVTITSENELGLNHPGPLFEEHLTCFLKEPLLLRNADVLNQNSTICVTYFVDKAPENLEASEWALINEIIPILKPVQKITEKLSGEQYPTLSRIICVARGAELITRAARSAWGRDDPARLIV
ncbi:unnamed protein product [Diatraea saccharalis]|uniref:Uncharacterized protein n=1 Tax=Diatraea saccharalis TaxID=40085 RepID=A0A9N9RBG2_9NEOP|nr:unnamed protein product [Diatraea saccharalis]